MIKVDIKKNNIVTNSAKFQTLELAQSWFEIEKANESFGKNLRQLQLLDLQLEGKSPEDAIATEEVELMGEMVTLYTLPAEYTIEYVDITQEIQDEQARQKSKLAIEHGVKIMSEIRFMNEKKTLTLEQFEIIINDDNLDKIERLIWNGSFKTAKMLTQAYQGAAFSAQEKQIIIEMLDLAIQECG